MASAAEIYKALAAGQRLTILVESKKDYEQLRVALCKHHETPSKLELIEGSLCSSFDSATSQATYWVGERRRRGKAIDYQIVGITDA